MAPAQAHSHSEIGRVIARLARTWRRESDQALSDHGLSYATAIPLLLLSRQGENVRQGVLADELGVEGPSLVRLIDLLQAEGLVERRQFLKRADQVSERTSPAIQSPDDD